MCWTRTSETLLRQPGFPVSRSRSIWTKSWRSSSESSRALPARPVCRTPVIRMGAEGARTVLVADDDEDVRSTIAEYLRADRLEVIEAADGFDTLLKVKRARPGVVVLDLLMPRLGW